LTFDILSGVKKVLADVNNYEVKVNRKVKQD